MNPEDLYNRLSRLLELEGPLHKDQTEEERACEYHKLFTSVPLLSVQDLIEYHRMMIEKGKIVVREDCREVLRPQLANRLQQICSPLAYSRIESILQQVFDSVEKSG